MKPKTIEQKKVFALSMKLPSLTDKNKKWAIRCCLPHLAYANKSNAFCLDCGMQMPLSCVSENKAICPNCSNKLKIVRTRKTTYSYDTYFAVACVVEGYQIVLYYRVFANYKKGSRADVWFQPVLEYWISPKGKCTKVGLIFFRNWNRNSWGGQWGIRKDVKGFMGKYKIVPEKYSPMSVFKSEYKKRGINRKLQYLDFWEVTNVVFKYPIAETLLKSKHWKLLYEFILNPERIIDAWPSLKICFRNQYEINDVGMWLDYVYLLKYFNKDLHNAKFICPNNLRTEHDILVNKKNILEKKIEFVEGEKKFAKKIHPFRGFKIEDKEIVIKVLESIEEFKNEGNSLNHCVYANAYFDKEDSLILSARINDCPIETIEVSLSVLEVLQSRGENNIESKYHKRILKLINKGLPKIGEIVRMSA